MKVVIQLEKEHGITPKNVNAGCKSAGLSCKVPQMVKACGVMHLGKKKADNMAVFHVSALVL